VEEACRRIHIEEPMEDKMIVKSVKIAITLAVSMAVVMTTLLTVATIGMVCYLMEVWHQASKITEEIWK
jgi:hypothetical protein